MRTCEFCLLDIRTGMKGRLKDSNSIVLQAQIPSVYVPISDMWRQSVSGGSNSWQICQIDLICRPKIRTFNICNKVVFPALSRPRNRSFACLLRRPSEARVSQTVQTNMSACYQIIERAEETRSYLHQLTIHIAKV